MRTLALLLAACLVARAAAATWERPASASGDCLSDLTDDLSVFPAQYRLQDGTPTVYDDRIEVRG